MYLIIQIEDIKIWMRRGHICGDKLKKKKSDHLSQIRG
jgi:hypothetical protein